MNAYLDNEAIGMEPINQDLRDYITQLNGIGWNMNIGTLREITRQVYDRFLHD